MSLVTIGTPVIYSDSGYCSSMEPDMATCSIPGPDNTLALGDNTDHSDQDDPGDSMALGYLMASG